MKKVLLAVVALSLLGAVSSDAGWFSKGKPRFPKPIDAPYLRPKCRLEHIPGHTRGHSDKNIYTSVQPVSDAARA